MRKVNFTILSILILLQCVLAQTRTEFQDFSQKGENYKSLENLKLAINDINYSGDEPINILGQNYTASKYSFTTKVKVQTLCAIGSVNTEVYELKVANFEILVVEDKDKTIHNAFAKMMYDTWSKKEVFSGKYFFDFNAKGNEYALTVMPDLLEGFYYIWVNGRLIKVVFKGFQTESGGFGTMVDSFTSDSLRVKIANSNFKAYNFPLSPKKNFLKLYRVGFTLPK